MWNLPDPSAIAHNWNALSHYPDRHAAAAIESARVHLDRFKAFLGKLADAGGAIDVAAEMETFRLRATQLYRRAWATEGGCMSSFITGPANFPVARAEKRMRTRDKAYAEISAHATAARKAVERRAFPYGAPDGPIRGNNPDAPELLRAEIEKHKAEQELMKRANAAIRSARPKGDKDAQADAVRLATGWSPATCRKVVEPDYMGSIGFPSYALQNNGANIRRLEERLQSLERKRAAGDSSEEHETSEGKVRLVKDAGADRLRLVFPGKPTAKTIAELKSRAFRWSPREGAWQRHLNTGSESHARAVLALIAR